MVWVRNKIPAVGKDLTDHLSTPSKLQQRASLPTRFDQAHIRRQALGQQQELRQTVPALMELPL